MVSCALLLLPPCIYYPSPKNCTYKIHPAKCRENFKNTNSFDTPILICNDSQICQSKIDDDNIRIRSLFMITTSCDYMTKITSNASFHSAQNAQVLKTSMSLIFSFLFVIFSSTRQIRSAVIQMFTFKCFMMRWWFFMRALNLITSLMRFKFHYTSNGNEHSSEYVELIHAPKHLLQSKLMIAWEAKYWSVFSKMSR